ncbi:hypothetical protein LWC34_51775 [Kibdelosporangium philippinense]|uniref:Uncharacterized protein n=1 Tax=Kibdelosporangium philippinense TaxID=211113 RepID=A0ABS8ZU20_9PSEU|nr:hypothetical protein [Kibdelosporangium philippinense]MCE7011235.1 hypothetical protein [Kibdelosporangium philippinense]
MGDLSRRAAMLGMPLAAAGTVAATTSAGLAVVEFTAVRAKNTLPLSPPLGAPFIIYLALRDATGASIGDGSFFGMVVDVTVDIPPKIVVSAKAIFRLPTGEVHASSMQLWKVPEGGVKHPMAIVGGTGAYASARGEGTIEHITADMSAVTLRVVTD